LLNTNNQTRAKPKPNRTRRSRAIRSGPIGRQITGSQPAFTTPRPRSSVSGANLTAAAKAGLRVQC